MMVVFGDVIDTKANNSEMKRTYKTFYLIVLKDLQKITRLLKANTM